MGLIKDIRAMVKQALETETISKEDLCLWLQQYIDAHAKGAIERAIKYQKKNPDKAAKYSKEWNKNHPEEYREDPREYKRNVRGYYEKHSKEILSKADDNLKNNRDPEIIEVEGAELNEENK